MSAISATGTSRPPSADELRRIGLAAGLAAVGFCDAEPLRDVERVLLERKAAGLNAEMQFTYRNPSRSTDPTRTLPSAKSIVVGALRYDTEVPTAPAGTIPHARVARYATADHYRLLRDALGEVKDHLKSSGYKAVVLADDNSMVDRAVAVKAGLGWYGKSANVLLPGRGSWFVLGSVLTSAPIDEAPELVADGCGSCTRCIDNCPTGAIVAPGVVDASRCLSWRLQAPEDFPREFREALGDRIYGCDDCQEFCPPSRLADRRRVDAPSRISDIAPEQDGEPSDRIGEGGSWIDVEWMLRASDEELLTSLGRWYVPNRDPRYLRRNALIVFGNTASLLSDSHVERLLGPYLDGEDATLKRHATWAVLRLGRDSILGGSRSNDPHIAHEIAAFAEGPTQGPVKTELSQ